MAELIQSNRSRYFREAGRYIPGGVNSPVRAFHGVGGDPVIIRRAEGAWLYGTDDKRYLDMINSWGPMILGHAFPEVVEAVREQAGRSFSFGTPTELELEMARLIVDGIPWIERIRMVNSGTEACMTAIRLARAYTGRSYFIKCRGCYHGHADPFLVEAGSGALTHGHPSSPGIPDASTRYTLIADFNAIEGIRQLFDEYPESIAGVILEPVAGNMGCIPPEPDYLQNVQRICRENGALFIVDEVMTGFRLGWNGACGLYQLDPDLVCYGKIIGGGLPVGACAGKAHIMDLLAPSGPVYQAGTLSGNPLAMTAGLTTLLHLKSHPLLYSRLEELGNQLEHGLVSLFNELSIPAQVNRAGSMISLFFTDQKVTDLTSALSGDLALFRRFFHHLLQSGIHLPPSAYESWFISQAFQEEHISFLLEACDASMR